jgi:hypothetical protein
VQRNATVSHTTTVTAGLPWAALCSAYNRPRAMQQFRKRSAVLAWSRSSSAVLTTKALRLVARLRAAWMRPLQETRQAGSRGQCSVQRSRHMG